METQLHITVVSIERDKEKTCAHAVGCTCSYDTSLSRQGLHRAAGPGSNGPRKHPRQQGYPVQHSQARAQHPDAPVRGAALSRGGPRPANVQPLLRLQGGTGGGAGAGGQGGAAAGAGVWSV